MAYREVSRVEIAEVVRRWQSGNSQRQIATGTGLSRATVRRYIVAAMGAGLTRDGAAPSEDQLSRLAGLNLCTPRKVETPTEEVLAPWADQVYEWLTADRLQVSRAERNQAVWRSKSVPLERRCSAKMSAYDGCRREPLVAARSVESRRQGNRWLSAW